MSTTQSKQGYAEMLFRVMRPAKRPPLTQAEIMRYRELIKNPNWCRERWAQWTTELKAHARGLR